MSALASITAAIADLQAAQQAEVATLGSVLTKLQELAAQPSVNPADVAAAAAQIEAVVSNLNNANTSAQAVLNPPPPAP